MYYSALFAPGWPCQQSLKVVICIETLSSNKIARIGSPGLHEMHASVCVHAADLLIGVPCMTLLETNIQPSIDSAYLGSQSTALYVMIADSSSTVN